MKRPSIRLSVLVGLLLMLIAFAGYRMTYTPQPILSQTAFHELQVRQVVEQ